MAYQSDRTGAQVDTTLDNADTHIAETVNCPHTAFATQLEMETGTESGERGMSPLRVAQAISALGGGGGLGYDAQGNLYTDDSARVIPATMINGLYLYEGLAPTDNPANECMMWAANQNAVAGTVCWNLESEDGIFYSFGTKCGLGLLAPTRELEVNGDTLSESYETDSKVLQVHDTHTGVITSNDLAFPSDANVITVPAGTVNTVSGVTAGARYTLVALGAVTLTDGANVVCRGGNITLAVDESVECVGLSPTKISISTKP